MLAITAKQAATFFTENAMEKVGHKHINRRNNKNTRPATKLKCKPDIAKT